MPLVEIHALPQPASVDPHAPIVHVYVHRTPEEVARVVDVVQRLLARELALEPGNVFVTVQPVELLEPHG